MAGYALLKDQFMDMVNLSSHQKGEIAMFCSTQEWNLVLRRNINDWELERLGQKRQLLSSIRLDHNRADSICWKSHHLGLFSVWDYYHMLDSSIDRVFCPWDKICRNIAPLKVSCFSWTDAIEACLTQSNLQKWKIQLCSRCPLCEEHRKKFTTPSCVVGSPCFLSF